MHDVFVSYAHEDRQTAKLLAEALAARGWTVWWDRKTRAGVYFEDVIQNELTRCKCAIVIWSAHSVASAWVRNEAADAAERGVLLPVRIDGTKIPISLRHLHAADLTEWNGEPEHGEWNEVLQRVEELAPRDPALDRAPTIEVPPAEPRATPAPRRPEGSGLLTEREQTAVDMAVAASSPLFVEGPPGSGKTHIAEALAVRHRLEPPLVFETRSDSTVLDLLYQFDRTRRLHDAQTRPAERPVGHYLTLRPLGLAIALSADVPHRDAVLPPSLDNSSPRRLVVLIEHVDRGSRDFMNDLAGYLKAMSFVVKEAGDLTFSASPARWPIVVITSTAEKHVPDSLLRQVIYHAMEFPDRSHLLAIAKAHNPDADDHVLHEAIDYFMRIRNTGGLETLPSLAEFLTWVRVLIVTKVDPHDIGRQAATSAAMLLKNFADRQRVRFGEPT